MYFWPGTLARRCEDEDMPRVFDCIDRDLLPALAETMRLADRADFCVGNLDLRGWRLLDAHVKHWDGGEGHCCRVLVGMQRLPHIVCSMGLLRKPRCRNPSTGTRQAPCCGTAPCNGYSSKSWVGITAARIGRSRSGQAGSSSKPSPTSAAWQPASAFIEPPIGRARLTAPPPARRQARTPYRSSTA